MAVSRFFGLFTFSFSGRLDRLDWVFYWGDAISMLMLPSLFLHFALVFPERTRRWASDRIGRILVPLIYVPAAALAVARIVVLARSASDASLFVGMVGMLDRLEHAYLAACFVAGLVALTPMFGDARSITARRQLRWITWGTSIGIAPFVFGYAIPWTVGVEPSLPMQLSAVPLSLVPLAYASAIVRYRLMDIEVIIKRTLGYIAAVAAVVAIYVVLLQGLRAVFARQRRLQLDSRRCRYGDRAAACALGEAGGAERSRPAFYRDRYDYRRALVGFARDLNRDLDLNRLAERFVARVMETLVVDRMALMVASETAPQFEVVAASGFDERPPIAAGSEIGARLAAGHLVALDDPIAASGFSPEEFDRWRSAGLSYSHSMCVE